MKLYTRLSATLSIVLLLVSACGYHFTGEGAGPRPGIHKVSIPVFANNTSEPDLGSIFAGALRSEFLQKGDIQVVPQDQSDVVFRGRIRNIYTSEVAHKAFEETILSRLYVTLEIRCEDTRTGEILWQDPQFTYYQVYIQDPDPMVSYDNRRRAEEFLAKEMSSRIHDRFLSNF